MTHCTAAPCGASGGGTASGSDAAHAVVVDESGGGGYELSGCIFVHSKGSIFNEYHNDVATWLSIGPY